MLQIDLILIKILHHVLVDQIKSQFLAHLTQHILHVLDRPLLIIHHVVLHKLFLIKWLVLLQSHDLEFASV